MKLVDVKAFTFRKDELGDFVALKPLPVIDSTKFKNATKSK